MASNGKHDAPSPPYSPHVEFRDPFASVEGGIGSLKMNAAEVKRAHAYSKATSTISAQCSVSDGGVDSIAASSKTSTTSLTTLTSQEVLPSIFLPLETAKEDAAIRSLSFIPGSSGVLMFPTAELDHLESVGSNTPTSHGSSSSLEADLTPRPSSRIGDSGRGVSLDGGVDLPNNHGARLSPIPFTTSPASITRPASVTASMQSYRSNDCAEDDWNIETLREMTDLVREALPLGPIPSASVETLSEILKALLIDEQGLSNTVGLDTVALTYFDKTLDAILSQTTRNTALADPGIQELFLRATSLQHRWQQRFKERYFSIDDVRIKDIRENTLHDLTLNEQDWRTGQMWLVGHNEPISHQQGDLGFEVGSWWLNIACAFRDGIVSGVDERATRGPYNVTALPLLSGEEVEGPTLNMYEYIKRGTSKEMPFSILGSRGGPIRILRGHALKSKFAPKIGVRYDGLYIVKQYGHKLVNAKNNIYQCRLILERLTGQKPIKDIILLPTPSQIDAWALYIRIIGDHIRARQGDAAFSEWRELLDRETMDKEEFLQKKALEASIPRYKVVKRKQITSKD